jgi:hypothetical protein
MEALRASAVDAGALKAERSQHDALETAHATLQAWRQNALLFDCYRCICRSLSDKRGAARFTRLSRGIQEQYEDLVTRHKTLGDELNRLQAVWCDEPWSTALHILDLSHVGTQDFEHALDQLRASEETAAEYESAITQLRAHHDAAAQDAAAAEDARIVMIQVRSRAKRVGSLCVDGFELSLANGHDKGWLCCGDLNS